MHLINIPKSGRLPHTRRRQIRQATIRLSAIFTIVLLAACSGSSGGGSVQSVAIDQGEPDVDGSVTDFTESSDSGSVSPDSGSSESEDNRNEEVVSVVRIMPLGDSITHGLLEPGPSASWRLPFSQLLDDDGCAYQLVGSQTSNALHDAFESPHEGYSGHEAGHFVLGYTNWAGENPGIFASMEQHSPNIVLLHIGTNDAIKMQDTGETLQEIDQIVSTILDANSDVLLANIIPTYTEDFLPGVDNQIAELAAMIEAYVAQLANPRVQLVDVREGYDVSFMFSDGIHPNDEGSQHIAEAFYAAYKATPHCL